MIEMNNFVGVVVGGDWIIDQNTGRMIYRVADKSVFGTGFVVDSAKGIVLTNWHVIPDEARKREYAFFLLDSLHGVRVTIVDNSSISRWAMNDVIAFRIKDERGLPPNDLKTYPWYNSEVTLTQRVSVLGAPLNQYNGNNTVNSVTIRALTGFVVTTREDKCEIDCSIIQGMSGSPVCVNFADGQGAIAGIAFENVKYALEMRTRERSITESGDGKTIKEISEYEEVLRFGVFYKYIAFSRWLGNVIAK